MSILNYIFIFILFVFVDFCYRCIFFLKIPKTLKFLFIHHMIDYHVWLENALLIDNDKTIMQSFYHHKSRR